MTPPISAAFKKPAKGGSKGTVLRVTVTHPLVKITRDQKHFGTKGIVPLEQEKLLETLKEKCDGLKVPGSLLTRIYKRRSSFMSRGNRASPGNMKTGSATVDCSPESGIPRVS